MGISIIVPTCNGGQVFEECLCMIGKQDYNGEWELIVIDSGSTDGTPERAAMAGASVVRIDPKDFHHSRTRNMALCHAGHDAVVFLVQDAIPWSRSWLSDLEKALLENNVTAVYTQQMPHDDATAYARFEVDAHARYLGDQPIIHRFASPQHYLGMPYDEAYRDIRLNNVCAIYAKKDLLASPFPDEAFAEDMAWALENLLSGRRIMYQPEIKVKHSHNRSPAYRFNREVVNSFYCAKIMKRVREDLSQLTVSDLIHLTCRIDRISCDIRRALRLPTERQISPGDVSVARHILNRYSYSDQLKYHLYNRFLRSKPPRKKLPRDLESNSRGQIEHILNRLRQSESPSPAQLLDSLEQAAAGALGRIYGEAYASRFINSQLNPRLESFMAPFFRGV